MDFLPTLGEWSGPLYLRIADALAADIAGGRLARGQQLPTHRALAKALGIDLTTVTRAYNEARRRGLIEARVGQGTFVSETTVRAAPDGAPAVRIDLSMNVPPHPVEANLEVRIAQGLAEIQRRSGFTAFLNYQRPGGSDEDCGVATDWLRRRVPAARADRLVIYPGNQAALFGALLALTQPGDTVLAEALTFPGIKAAAEERGVRLVGVAMDADGIVPEALEDACARHRPKAVYLVPTLNNPTTATLPPPRREAVASIIRRHDTVLIEDDVYGPLEPSASPVANLIPERTYLATSLSKCIAPALRVSYLLAPDAAAAQAMRGVLQAMAQMAPPLMVALASHWLGQGIADQIVAAIRDEAAGRQRLAGRLLKGLPFAARPHGHHLWLTLPPRRDRRAFVEQVLREGLAVVASDAFATTDDPPHAVRVALGAPRDRADLARGLVILAAAMRSAAAAVHIV